MARTHTISARRSTSAPAATVWHLLIDVDGWTDWGPFDPGALAHRGGPPAPRLRWMTAPTGATTLANVVAHDHEHHFAYEMHSKVPQRDHMSQVHLSESDGLTNIDWRATYRVRMPGTARTYQRRLSDFLDELITALGREAERRHAAV